MNTTQLKRFATEARNKLREGVKGRLIKLGFDIKSGDVPEAKRPTEVQGGGSWMGHPVSTAFVRNWNDLYHHTKQIGINQMIEEGAYTWFNRLVAIRILAKNNLCAPVLQFVDSARTPLIVDEARAGRMPEMPEENRRQLDELLDDDSKTAEQFAVLINAWVNNNAIISACFDARSKAFMELLLPDDVLSEGGFLSMLNGADFISDEDYLSPELIGWLYQFYISEKKDQVFAKKGKYDADEIPAATQIFTPNWIVKYMVQNTVLPQVISKSEYGISEAELKNKYKYLVLPPDFNPDGHLFTINYDLELFRVADLACGSGHILNECFDLLYELYIHEGYSRREAVTKIFEQNLTGIDIDLRAKQLATFALLLKACQRDASFADAHCLPKVLSVPTMTEIVRDPRGYLPHFFLGTLSASATDELCESWKDIKNADVLGSIIKFDISDATRRQIKAKVGEWRRQDFTPQGIQDGLPIMDFILALAEQYDALVMNPPYMPTNKIDILSSYVKKNYEEGKADMFAVFMQVCMDRLRDGGRMGMINMQSWMFLSSFESLRKLFLKEYTLSSMLHLGPRTFDELSGDVVQNTAFVFEKTESNAEITGTYYRLVDGKNCSDKERMFLTAKNVFTIPQTNFDKIPGSPIVYWVSDSILEKFKDFPSIGEVSEVKIGMGTGKNEIFVREWFEISYAQIDKTLTSVADLENSCGKYFPYNKGGQYRKWYGNLMEVLWFDKDGRTKMDTMPGHRENGGYNRYCNQGLTWSFISSNNFGIRFLPSGCFFDVAGSSLFSTSKLSVEFILGFLSSNVCYTILRMLNPTVNFQAGNIKSLPIPSNENDNIREISTDNITIAKADWDAHETSWDFQENEIVGLNTADKYVDLVNGIYEGTGIMVDLEAPKLESLEWRTGLIKDKWTNKFNRLHDNEVELNRRFIEIYGLQDELTPDVPLDEVTILQQGEISIWKEGDPIPREVRNGDMEFSPIIWHDDVLMKQLISYAVGCMMGRYRLDRPGLAIAHPNPTAEEIAPYEFNGETFEIDDDAIIPLMPTDCGFYDNATQRLSDFVRQVFGEQSQAENLNYIEKCLGKTIEQYFIKDFWKDHKKMYQNRPIYWLFSSKKGTFQVIAYMHRMTPYTVERIRAKYLLPYIETLNSRIAKLAAREAELSTTERKQLDALGKQLEECREYHDRLAVVAEQAIAFDLDDGIPHNHALFGDILTKLK